MFKMVVEINEEKVLKEQKYDVNEIKTLIRHICLDNNFKESSPNHYYLENQYSKIGEMMLIDQGFRMNDCIIPNLSKWITYSDEDGEINQLNKKKVKFH